MGLLCESLGDYLRHRDTAAAEGVRWYGSLDDAGQRRGSQPPGPERGLLRAYRPSLGYGVLLTCGGHTA